MIDFIAKVQLLAMNKCVLLRRFEAKKVCDELLLVRNDSFFSLQVGFGLKVLSQPIIGFSMLNYGLPAVVVSVLMEW